MRKRTQDDASDNSADDTDMAVDGTGTGRRHDDVEVHEQHKRVRGLHDSPGAASTASGTVACCCFRCDNNQSFMKHKRDSAHSQRPASLSLVHLCCFVAAQDVLPTGVFDQLRAAALEAEVEGLTANLASWSISGVCAHTSAALEACLSRHCCGVSQTHTSTARLATGDATARKLGVSRTYVRGRQVWRTILGIFKDRGLRVS